MGRGGAEPPWVGGDGRRGCEHGSRHHTLPFMGAEVVLIWAVVFQFLRSGSRLGVVLPRGHLGYLYLPVGFLGSLELLGFPNKVLVSKKSLRQRGSQRERPELWPAPTTGPTLYPHKPRTRLRQRERDQLTLTEAHPNQEAHPN